MATDLQILKDKRHTYFSIKHQLGTVEIFIRELKAFRATISKEDKLAQKIVDSVINCHDVAMETASSEHAKLNERIIEANSK